METRDWIELILSSLIGLGALAGGGGYLYGKYLEGRAQRAKDVAEEEVSAYEILEKKVKTLTDEVIELRKEVGKLTEEIVDKNKKLAETLNILQGRDPVTSEIILAMKTYMEDNKPFIENIKMRVIPVVMKLDKFLDGQVIK